jgi:hypothetical protein
MYGVRRAYPGDLHRAGGRWPARWHTELGEQLRQGRAGTGWCLNKPRRSTSGSNSGFAPRGCLLRAGPSVLPPGGARHQAKNGSRVAARPMNVRFLTGDTAIVFKRVPGPWQRLSQS